jgi:hypothetical protein
MGVSYHWETIFIHLKHLLICSAALEMLPGHPAPVMNTFGIAFLSSRHDPEGDSLMIPLSGHPIVLLSTNKSCMSNPSPIGPISFLPSINPTVPSPEANELGRLHMGQVSSLSHLSRMPKLTFLISQMIQTPKLTSMAQNQVRDSFHWPWAFGLLAAVLIFSCS